MKNNGLEGKMGTKRDTVKGGIDSEGLNRITPCSRERRERGKGKIT